MDYDQALQLDHVSEPYTPLDSHVVWFSILEVCFLSVLYRFDFIFFIHFLGLHIYS